MYAVVQTGGKQYRVAEGDVIRVEKLDGEAGSNVDLTHVAMIGGDSVQVGTPWIDGGKVSAEIVKQARARKIEVVKFKRRQGYLRKHGHRQSFTELKITGIAG